MQKHTLKNTITACVLAIAGAAMLQSCGSEKNLLIPHSVSTAAVTTVKDLNLTKGQYDILQTITESASVTCEYRGNTIRINSGEGDFSYRFEFDKKAGWTLASFSGAAALGYFTDDYNDAPAAAPCPEEFARSVAMARIISAAADFGADGIVEPLTMTTASNAGNNKVEYRATVRAKLIVLKTAK